MRAQDRRILAGLIVAGAAAAGILAAVTAAAVVSSRRRASVLSGPLRVRALRVALEEAGAWGSRAPDTARVDQYLAGCVPNGAELVELNSDARRVNFCAAAVGWTEHQSANGARLPPWRAAAKRIMVDAISGARGEARWHPAHELAAGWRPPFGALAVYHRGDPDSPSGHVDRVVRVLGHGFEAIGANEGGRRWALDVTRFSSAALLGFVVDGEPGAPTAVLGRGIPPIDFVEPPLSEEERRQIRGV